jgi:pyruvate dehydrogenase E2 component (dihydrolipoamide acetyltransferase)
MAEKELTLPRMGETMDEGTIVAWLKQPGELFRRGDTLLEVESDKTNVEIPALEDGEMVRHLVLPGEKVAVDRPIALVKTLGTSLSISTEAQPVLQASVTGSPPYGKKTGDRLGRGQRHGTERAYHRDRCTAT